MREKLTEKLTEELLNELLFTQSITDFLQEELKEELMTLPEYVNHMLQEKNLKKSVVIKESKMNPTHAYHLFSGKRKAGKDKLLQLAFAMGLTLRESQRLLKIGGGGELYCKSRRDAIMIYALNKEMTLTEVEELLFQWDEETLLKDEG